MKEESKQLTLQDKNKALRFVQFLIFIGGIAIMLFAMKTLWWEKKNSPTVNFISTFSVGLLVAGSALTAGLFAGFIFAIPKAVSNANTNLIKAGTVYISNDNLVQISDWLTKIIVGVGLTKLTHIPGYIQSVGKYGGPAMGGNIWGEVAVEVILLHFSICGFLLAYLWTRLYFGRMLTEADWVDTGSDHPNPKSSGEMNFGTITTSKEPKNDITESPIGGNKMSII